MGSFYRTVTHCQSIRLTITATPEEIRAAVAKEVGSGELPLKKRPPPESNYLHSFIGEQAALHEPFCANVSFDGSRDIRRYRRMVGQVLLSLLVEL
jgi:hypothetical protein